MDPVEKLFGWRSGEAERNRNDAHERPIAVAVFAVVAAEFSTDSGGESRQSTRSGNPDIEHLSMRSPQVLAIPRKKSFPHVLGVVFMSNQAVR